MRRYNTLAILCLSTLVYAGCFVDPGPTGPAECELAVIHVGDQWCAELEGAQMTNAAGQQVDLLDSATQGHPAACLCLSLAESMALSSPQDWPVESDLVKDKLRNAAMENCEQVADDLGVNFWDTTCATADPVLTFEGSCSSSHCEVYSDGGVGDATAGAGGGSDDAPPAWLGLSSWTDAVSCSTEDECIVDEGVALAVAASPGVLLEDTARFESTSSTLGVDGLQLVAASSTSLTAALGLQVGDTIVNVNQMALADVEDAMMALLALSSETVIEIEVHRGREAVVKSFTLGAL